LHQLKAHSPLKNVLKNYLNKTIKKEYNPEQFNIILSSNFTLAKNIRVFL
jgi:hypothetical protein